MAQYIIGDVQGCFDSLMILLEKISYDHRKDELIFAGDVVNRGPKSLETLRFVTQTNNCKVVLGNHDLHLLAVDAKRRRLEPLDTLEPILQAPDRWELIRYLTQCPLALINKRHNYIVVHAGIPPMMPFDVFEYSLDALEKNFHAHAENYLCGKTNSFLRAISCIRFCREGGEIDYSFKGELADGRHQGLYPWFDYLHPTFDAYRVFFGHWAALNAKTSQHNIVGLDTGCVWGGYLSAYCLQEEKIYSVKAVEDGI